jgi:phage tail-like protein
VVGWFAECTSLSVERAVTPYAEGGVNSAIVQLPGQVSYTKVTLRGGLAGGALWNWFQSGQHEGSAERRAITVVVLDATGEETARWDLLNCMPLRWVGPTMSAGAAQVAVEEIEIGRGEGSASPATVQRLGEVSPFAVKETKPDQLGLDLAALAIRVYELIRQDLRLERERAGQRGP